MTDANPLDATPRRRMMATGLNLLIVVAMAGAAEAIAASSSAPTAAARSLIAFQAWFGLTVLFWLCGGQLRTSPGLVALKMQVVRAEFPDQRITLVTALIRPLPFFLFGLVLAFPVGWVPWAWGPVQFVLVLIISLLLAANAAPLWSGPDRRTLLDRGLKTRVVRK